MAAAANQKEYIVLFTHQKTKKHKTWQDGILKFSGQELKARLYDDQMKHLDSIFIRPNQKVACGEELESDRYLITVEEERRQALPDISFQPTYHSEKSHAVDKMSSNFQQPSQACKRKRQGFKPPRFVRGSQFSYSDQDPLLQPLEKKQRVQGLEFDDEAKTMKQKRYTKEEFLHLYSQHGTCSQDLGFGKEPTLSNVENYCVSRVASQHLLSDQTVPCGSYSTARESAVSSATIPHRYIHDGSITDGEKSPKLETVQSAASSNSSLLPPGKRNTSQMLALFCSKRRIPPVGVLVEQNCGRLLQVEENYNSSDLSVTIENDGDSKIKSSFKDNFYNTYQTGIKQQVGNSDVHLKRQSEKQPGYSTGTDQGMNLLNENEGSNLNKVSPILTPDSFITDQSQVETPEEEQKPTGEGVKQGSYCVSDRRMMGRKCSPQQSEDPLDAFMEAKEEGEGNTKRGEQKSIEKTDLEIEDKIQGPGCSELIKGGESQISFEADSETLSPFLGKILHTTLDDDRRNIEVPRNDVPFGDRTQIGVGNLALNGHRNNKERDLDIQGRFNYDSQPRNDKSFPYKRPGPHCGFKHHLASTNEHFIDTIRQSVSTHPGSLFQYRALGRASTVGFSSLEPMTSGAAVLFGLDEVENVHGGVVCAGAQPGLSPEFFPPRTTGNFEPTQTEFITKVITSQDREVKGGEGHSWKGSVVSDTVKRNKPCFYKNKRLLNEVSHDCSATEASWIDCIGEEVRCTDDVMAAPQRERGESVAHNSTQGRVGCMHITDSDELSQTVPCLRPTPTPSNLHWSDTDRANLVSSNIQRRLHSRRTPLITQPPGDEDVAACMNLPSSCSSLTASLSAQYDCSTLHPHTKFSSEAGTTSQLPFGLFFSDNEHSHNVLIRGNAAGPTKYETNAPMSRDNHSREIHCNATDLFACSDNLCGEGPTVCSMTDTSSRCHASNSMSRYDNLSAEMEKGCSANDGVLVVNAAVQDDSMKSSYPGPLHSKEGVETSSRVNSRRRVGLSRVSRDTVGVTTSDICAKQSLNVNCLKAKGFQPPISKIVGQASTVGKHEMGGELFFPSAGECDSNATPTRQVMIPTTFENVFHYRQVFKTALREHLNIILFELAQSYHSTLGKVDVSGYSAYEGGSGAEKPEQRGPSCPHGVARLRAVKKDGPNKGRLFYCCPGTGQNQCKFFKWVDQYQGSRNKSRNSGQCTSTKPTLTTADDITAFFRSHNVSLYCGCTFVRRQSERFGRQTSFRRNSKSRHVAGHGVGEKRSLYLELSRKESSSTYSKDDIWIISKGLSFERGSIFIAKSVYYGPSSAGQLEITPMSGYSPSNWHSGETVHALLACSAGTELTCITNLEEHVKAQTMPLLPHIMYSKDKRLEPDVRRPSRGNVFIPPAQRINVVGLGLSWGTVVELADDLIEKYHLNKDQAAALKLCANMFTVKENATTSYPVTLIHGVFGAGKSFLLAVAVLFLVKVFHLADSSDLSGCTSTQKPLKILISSTTNVAVDRILLGLLDLGYEDFVRVGSLRKIAKPVLPYSVHSTGSESQELRELQDILKGDLTPSEKTLVRKSIERHKLGENKKKLSQVRVVGVTCAACVFPCMDNLKFPVLLLDECSQMTEPASLIPLARFECQKLVLVGDPKQLSPTIQGSQPQHRSGLEQTMFDRLVKMGHDPIMLRTQAVLREQVDQWNIRTSSQSAHRAYDIRRKDWVRVCIINLNK